MYVMEHDETMINQITLADIIPYVSAIIAVLAFSRSLKGDTKSDIVSITTLANKLDHISDGMREIKSDLKDLKGDILDLRERMTAVENSSKSAHKRIDALEGLKHEREE